MAFRTGQIARSTRETEISLSLNLDGAGISQIQTGVGFLDHMLELLSRHSLFDLSVSARGDRHVDDHHTTEDVGICLGLALDQALADKAGIRRYGHAILPMDETLATVAVDLGGRFFLGWDVAFPGPRIGSFDTELVEEFWRAVALNGRFNLHAMIVRGGNAHHVSEALFKAAARALRMATEIDPRMQGVPSTKGSL